jgi:hypothetical protein
MERRLAAGLVAMASAGLFGCPYEAPVEPAGTPLAPQGADVGVWRCTSREGGEQADLSIGRSDSSTYLLSLRGTEPRSDNDPDDDPPLLLYAKPRRVAGREIWVLSEAFPTRPKKFFYLAEVERRSARERSFRLVSDDHVPADPSTPADLSRAFGKARRQEGFFDGRIPCRRRD